jgi:arylsulfatase A-like enzyme
MKIRIASIALVVFLLGGQAVSAQDAKKPNIVIVLADDMGWRDTGYSGNTIVKTPHLDSMAKTGIRFDNFYVAQQMCSPGRFAIMTGRNPFRTGLHALGAMRPQEVTIAQLLKRYGYATAHFGKWHLGSGNTHPVRMGFDKSYFSLNFFDIGGTLAINDTKEKVKITGDSSVFTMNLALDFIRKQAADKKPFFAYVCFGSPHSPHIGAREFKKLYDGVKAKNVDFLAEVSGVDAAVGSLREELRKLGIADDTIVWFTSDNGGITPQSMDPSGKGKMSIGVRTVACMEWPGRFKDPIRTAFPCLHQDMLPTLVEAAGSPTTSPHLLDGISLMPMLEGKVKTRERPIGFLLKKKNEGLDKTDFVKDTQGIWIDWPFKLIVTPEGAKAGKGPKKAGPQASVILYHLVDDPAEKKNIAEKHPEQVATMRRGLEAWQQSVRDSYDGKDFKK